MKRMLFLTGLMVAAVAGTATAEVPTTLHYQGVLRDANGGPVADGDYTVDFRLYDGSGTLLWSETQTVDVERSTFAALLGSGTALDLDFDEPYWLGIAIEGEDELEPRLPLAAAPYARRAALADSLVGWGPGGADADWTIAGNDMYAGVPGHVGIGTPAPAARFEVHGEDQQLRASSALQPGRAIEMLYETQDGPLIQSLLDERLTIDAHAQDWGMIQLGRGGDYVGIGVPVPSQMLEVAGNALVGGNVTTGGGLTVGGTATVGGLTLPAGAQSGYLLTSDGAGNGSWQPSPGANVGWLLSGNAGTSPPSDFLGTTDGQPLVVKVNGAQVLRCEKPYTGVAPNLIGGYSGNSASSGVEGATIGGGGDASYENTVTDDWGTIGGGWGNRTGDDDPEWERPYGTIAGGKENIAQSICSTVGGGYSNYARNQYATIGGGYDNTAHHQFSTVGGGTNNVASGDAATVGGGALCRASGMYSCVPGGRDVVASGNWSFAAGNKAKANHDGSVVLCANDNFFYAADSIRSGGDEQMVLRADGGVYITNIAAGETAPYTPERLINTSTGAYLNDAGVWVNAASEMLMEPQGPVAAGELLERLAAVEILTWREAGTSGGSGSARIAPRAGDFRAAFGVGQDDEGIAPLDQGGVALACIKELTARLEAQAAEIERLRAQIARLEP